MIDFQDHLLDNIGEQIVDMIQTSSHFGGLNIDEMKLVLDDSTCKHLVTLYNNAAHKVELKMKNLFATSKKDKLQFDIEGTYNNDIIVRVEAKNIYAKILTA